MVVLNKIRSFKNFSIFLIVFLILFLCGAPSSALENEPKTPDPEGSTVFAAGWGGGDGQAGAATEAKAVHDFMSPTSFLVSGDRLYVLDAPNFRVIIYDLAAKKSAGKIDLARKAGAELMLYTDLAALPGGVIAVSSSREKAVYKFTRDGRPAGVVKPSFGPGLITRIASCGGPELLIEDPVTEKIYLMDEKGSKTWQSDVANAQAVLVSGPAALKYEIVPSQKAPYNVKVRFIRPGRELPEKVFVVPFDAFVHNFMVAGEEKGGGLILYAVLGGGGDDPGRAEFVRLSPDGKVLKRIAAPVSPEMLTMRYLRATPDGKVYFARSNEDGYTISEFEF